MVKITRCFCVVLLVAGFSLPTNKSYGGSSTPMLATEITQIMNNIELMGLNLTQVKSLYNSGQQLVNQAQQLINEALMIEMQIKNLATLTSNPLALVNQLFDLSRVVQQGQILSYVATNIEGEVNNKYNGYSAYSSNGLTSTEMVQKFNDWSQDNLDNIVAHLKSANIQEETIDNEEARVASILLMSQSAEGRLQAIQAGNQIAAEQVRGLQRLRKLLMDQAQFRANFAAIENDKEDVNLAKWREITAPGTPTNTSDGNSIYSDLLSP